MLTALLTAGSGILAGVVVALWLKADLATVRAERDAEIVSSNALKVALKVQTTGRADDVARMEEVIRGKNARIEELAATLARVEPDGGARDRLAELGHVVLPEAPAGKGRPGGGT